MAQTNSRVGRREFLKTTAGVTIVAPSAVRGTQANSRLELGVIGSGGRGRFVAKLFEQHTNTKVVALHDYFADRVDKLGDGVVGRRRRAFHRARRLQGAARAQARCGGGREPAVLPPGAGGCGPPGGASISILRSRSRWMSTACWRSSARPGPPVPHARCWSIFRPGAIRSFARRPIACIAATSGRRCSAMSSITPVASTRGRVRARPRRDSATGSSTRRSPATSSSSRTFT